MEVDHNLNLVIAWMNSLYIHCSQAVLRMTCTSGASFTLGAENTGSYLVHLCLQDPMSCYSQETSSKLLCNQYSTFYTSSCPVQWISSIMSLWGNNVHTSPIGKYILSFWAMAIFNKFSSWASVMQINTVQFGKELNHRILFKTSSTELLCHKALLTVAQLGLQLPLMTIDGVCWS